MSDIALDLKTGDLDLSVLGAPRMTTSPDEALAQRLWIKLQFFKGEWFLDTEFGVPYYQEILGVKTRLNVIDAILQAAIIETGDVASINSFTSSLDAANRTYKATFRVTSALTGNNVEVTI